MTENANIWHYIKNYKFNSLFFKNARYILAVALLPVIVISILIHNYYNYIYNNEIIKTNTLHANQAQHILDSLTDQVQRQANLLITDNDIRMFFLNHSDVSTTELMNRVRNIDRLFNVLINDNDYLESIYLYSDFNNLVLGTNYRTMLEHFHDYGWYEIYRNRNNLTAWYSVRESTDYLSRAKYLSFFRVHTHIGRNHFNGVVVMNLSFDRLDRTLGKDVGDIVVLDNYNRIIYSTDRALIGMPASYKSVLHNLSIEQSYFYRNESGRIHVYGAYSENGMWRVVSIMPLQIFAAQRLYMISIITAFVFISILLALILAFYLSMKIFNPIKNIISVINNPEDWMDNARSSDKNNDEFRYISENILKKVDNAKQMTDLLAERMLQLDKAKSIALQTQINPHFLFNTMETMNMLAFDLTKSKNHITDIISMLSTLLRYSLQTQNQIVEISDEIYHASVYLNLLKVRYEDKFDVEWDIDKTLINSKICKLSLQPLLENSIYHGIKPLPGHGKIKISIKRNDTGIGICISDNGIGLNAESLLRVRNLLETHDINEDEHIGLSNVQQRIKIIFGNDYGITLTSEENAGTAVILNLPYIDI